LIHGSEGRHAAEHRARYPYSPFRAEGDGFADALAARAAMVRDFARTLGVPVFVATQDMLDFVDDAPWLPIVIEPKDFAPFGPLRMEGPPRVLHLPSQGVFKGSDAVDAALRPLHDAGIIEYVRPGYTPRQLVSSLIRSVDVVVDQVVLGNAATLANQTMAAGRISVGHVAPHVRRRYPIAPPIVEADPTTLADVVESIAADRAPYAEIAARGPGFARALHDGRLAARVLADHFLEPPTERTPE
jgi:hypothetical protein